MTEQKRNLWLNVCVCLALGLITLALYLPGARHDFIQYDDQQYVTENPQVQAGLTAHSLVWAFGYHAGNWHPLAWLSHMLDCQLYGLKPAGHHLMSILLHLATTVLLFLVLQRMTGATWRSAAVAALFAWHPLHVESVAWVAERKDVLCAFVWMLTLGTYTNYVEASKAQSPKSKVWYGGALLSFCLALMSKPMAVTLPFVLLLVDYWPLNRIRISNPGKVLLEKIPFFVLSVVACFLTMAAQEQAIVSTAGLPVLHRIAHALLAYQHYLVAMFVPYHLAVFYPYENTISTAKVAFAAALLTTGTVLLLLQVKRRPFLAVGWLWFLGTLVPVIGFVQVGEQAWADRYTYLPLIGLFVTFVWGVVDLAGNKRALRWTAIAVGLGLLITTSLQLRHWKNTRTLFEHAAKVTRNNHMAITLLGSQMAKEGRFDEAVQQYRLALSYQPHYAEGHFFLGHALDQQGKLEEAIAEYNQALRYKPLQEQTHIFLGAALAKQNKHDQAISHYFAALKLNPESAVAHNNLARLLHTEGRLDESIKHYSSALKLDPGLAQAHNNLGILLLQRGSAAEGTAQLREAARLNPGNTETEYNLALALCQTGQWSVAVELFTKTVGAANTDPNAHFQFGVALTHLERIREAASQLASALLLQPDFPDALAALSWILATSPDSELRNGAEAVAMAEHACDLTGRKDPAKLRSLAAAYAEIGQYPTAIATMRNALDLATNSGQAGLAHECQSMLENFKLAKPWRQSPAKP